MNSPFLDEKKVLENDLSYAFFDNYPVTNGHMLVVPKRLVSQIFDLNDAEYKACFDLVKEVQIFLKKKFNPDGFNIGVNCGKDAGQTIFHAHIHIIPRYKGDVKDPSGGVRNFIPGKGKY